MEYTGDAQDWRKMDEDIINFIQVQSSLVMNEKGEIVVTGINDDASDVSIDLGSDMDDQDMDLLGNQSDKMDHYDDTDTNKSFMSPSNVIPSATSRSMQLQAPGRYNFQLSNIDAVSPVGDSPQASVVSQSKPAEPLISREMHMRLQNALMDGNGGSVESESEKNLVIEESEDSSGQIIYTDVPVSADPVSNEATVLSCSEYNSSEKSGTKSDFDVTDITYVAVESTPSVPSSGVSNTLETRESHEITCNSEVSLDFNTVENKSISSCPTELIESRNAEGSDLTSPSNVCLSSNETHALAPSFITVDTGVMLSLEVGDCPRSKQEEILSSTVSSSEAHSNNNPNELEVSENVPAVNVDIVSSTCDDKAVPEMESCLKLTTSVFDNVRAVDGCKGEIQLFAENSSSYTAPDSERDVSAQIEKSDQMENDCGKQEFVEDRVEVSNGLNHPAVGSSVASSNMVVDSVIEASASLVSVDIGESPTTVETISDDLEGEIVEDSIALSIKESSHAEHSATASDDVVMESSLPDSTPTISSANELIASESDEVMAGLSPISTVSATQSPMSQLSSVESQLSLGECLQSSEKNLTAEVETCSTLTGVSEDSDNAFGRSGNDAAGQGGMDVAAVREDVKLDTHSTLTSEENLDNENTTSRVPTVEPLVREQCEDAALVDNDNNACFEHQEVHSNSTVDSDSDATGSPFSVPANTVSPATRPQFTHTCIESMPTSPGGIQVELLLETRDTTLSSRDTEENAQTSNTLLSDDVVACQDLAGSPRALKGNDTIVVTESDRTIGNSADLLKVESTGTTEDLALSSENTELDDPDMTPPLMALNDPVTSEMPPLSLAHEQFSLTSSSKSHSPAKMESKLNDVNASTSNAVPSVLSPVSDVKAVLYSNEEEEKAHPREEEKMADSIEEVEVGGESPKLHWLQYTLGSQSLEYNCSKLDDSNYSTSTGVTSGEVSKRNFNPTNTEGLPPLPSSTQSMGYSQSYNYNYNYSGSFGGLMNNNTNNNKTSGPSYSTSIRPRQRPRIGLQPLSDKQSQSYNSQYSSQSFSQSYTQSHSNTHSSLHESGSKSEQIVNSDGRTSDSMGALSSSQNSACRKSSALVAAAKSVRAAIQTVLLSTNWTFVLSPSFSSYLSSDIENAVDKALEEHGVSPDVADSSGSAKMELVNPVRMETKKKVRLVQRSQKLLRSETPSQTPEEELNLEAAGSTEHNLTFNTQEDPALLISQQILEKAPRHRAPFKPPRVLESQHANGPTEGILEQEGPKRKRSQSPDEESEVENGSHSVCTDRSQEAILSGAGANGTQKRKRVLQKALVHSESVGMAPKRNPSVGNRVEYSQVDIMDSDLDASVDMEASVDLSVDMDVDLEMDLDLDLTTALPSQIVLGQQYLQSLSLPIHTSNRSNANSTSSNVSNTVPGTRRKDILSDPVVQSMMDSVQRQQERALRLKERQIAQAVNKTEQRLAAIAAKYEASGISVERAFERAKMDLLELSRVEASMELGGELVVDSTFEDNAGGTGVSYSRRFTSSQAKLRDNANLSVGTDEEASVTQSNDNIGASEVLADSLLDSTLDTTVHTLVNTSLQNNVSMDVSLKEEGIVVPRKPQKKVSLKLLTSDDVSGTNNSTILANNLTEPKKAKKVSSSKSKLKEIPVTAKSVKTALLDDSASEELDDLSESDIPGNDDEEAQENIVNVLV